MLHTGEAVIRVGNLTSDRMAGLAVAFGLTLIATGLFLVRGRGWLTVLVVLTRLVAIAAALLMWFLLWLTGGATITDLTSNGCSTGYVVEEESFMFGAWGTVYRDQGLILTAVETTSADDGYHPFADGAYVAKDEGSSLRVWYDFARALGDSHVVDTAVEPAFRLPALPDARGCQ
jgi:hypothetical protein